jgi:Mg2+/Co2+ transporter CorB
MSLEEIPVAALLLSIVLLTMLSAYFSGTETAMMALNRYRLRHLVKERHRGARKANRLLRRPDRLLGVILIGNNLVNFTAATIATIIGMRLFGDTGVLLAPWVLTLTFLIFAEVAPKTLAAARPEGWAFRAVFALEPLHKALRPGVAFVNWFSNGLVRPFIQDDSESADHLSAEELKTVVNEGARAVGERQDMMVRLLDLEQVSVNDIMVPRTEIVGIDIDDEIADIISLASTSQHTLLPVYKESINNVLGILHLRRLARFLHADSFNKADLMQLTREPYYVPEATPLHTQLLNFQKEKQRIALVVDEYGELQGIVTLEDILEEIVGEFTSDFAANIPEILPQEDGSFLIDGMAVLRDINRALHWGLPIEGPKTLNGLVLEYLETIPESNLCLQIDEYQIETLQIKDNVVKSMKIRRLDIPQATDPDDLEDEEI